MASGNALASPLSAVTFVVLDLETTGASPTLDRITEIGALKLRGGELLGRIDTLVNPGVPIPPMITLLTGITEAMVVPAPRIGELLPTILEFLGDAVIVGHNIRFDCSFLDAALVTHGYPPLVNRRVDTIGMARRLVRDDVPNLRLHTLAQHFRTDTEPVHRAYADAAATAELFHTLLEHAATWGVLGLDDLVALPKIRVHSSTAKLALTARMPRVPGVYLFRDRRGRRAVRREGDQPPRTRPGLLLGRRPPPGPAVAARDGPHRAPRVRGPARSRGPRTATDRTPSPAVQPPDESAPPRRVPEADRTTAGRGSASSACCAAGDVALGPFSSSGAAHLAREAVERAVPEIAGGCRPRRGHAVCGSPPRRRSRMSRPSRTCSSMRSHRVRHATRSAGHCAAANRAALARRERFWCSTHRRAGSNSATDEWCCDDDDTDHDGDARA